MRTFSSLLIAGALAFSMAACQQGAAGGSAATDEDFAMGPATAKVTVVEYASVACPHCAAFDNEVFPAFKAKFIDTGKVRYVAREALTGDPAIAAAGFLTARCAGKDKYFKVVEAIYHAQATIMGPGGEPHAGLLAIARSVGMTDAQFESCIKDETALNALNARWNKYVTEDKIDSTPTFVVNGKMLPPGEITMEKLSVAVTEAEAGAKAAS